MTHRLPRTVVVLGLVSLLTDLASEMVYPLLPLFLTTVLGVGAVSIGVIEGAAESVAALLKVVSGALSDRLPRRKPLVLGGYAVSGAARPLIGLAAAWPAVLVLRLVDRVGKGLRGAPRDALIADIVTAEQRGAAYGVNRAMDHAGAVLGPLAAAALLRCAGLDLRTVFVLTAVPAVAVVVVLAVAVREPKRAGGREPWTAPWTVWGRFDSRFRRFLLALCLFSLGNSSDAFLLLLLVRHGLTAAEVAVLWAAHHVVKAIATYVGGRLSDALGRRRMLLSGWALYAAVYLGFAATGSSTATVVLFLVYGLYFGLCEPVERAFVADLAPAPLRGAAFGLIHGAVALTALPASALFGVLWTRFGPGVAFTTGAALAALASVVLLTVREERA